jgi:uncharacterized protein
MLIPGRYRAPPWLPGGHAQTIAAALAPRPHVSYRREIWGSPDGDLIAVDFAQPEPADPGVPVLVLFHGLEGSSRSHYARWLMQAAVARNWRACVAHFRGCGGQVNRLPRAYHSGDAQEADWILRAAASRWPAARLYAVGVSLGGNVLARWLGERASAGSPLQAAAVVSVPFDLTAAGISLARGFNAAVYGRHFLRSMRRKAADFALRHPGLIDIERVRASRDLRQFDDAFTAPLHGFRDVMHYWRSASSFPWLQSVATPLLALNARNDPFVPAGSLPGAADVSGHVVLEQPAQGGHAGFVQGAWPGDQAFVPRRVMDFFESGR